MADNPKRLNNGFGLHRLQFGFGAPAMRWLALSFVLMGGTWADVQSPDCGSLPSGVLFSADAFVAAQCGAVPDRTLCFHYPYDPETMLASPLGSLQADNILRLSGLGAMIPQMRNTSPSTFACISGGKIWIETDWRTL